MSKPNQITAGELIHGPNRRRFLGYLSAAPTLTGLAGAGLVSSRSAFAANGPLDATERRHQAFVIRRDAAIYQRDLRSTPSVSNGDEQTYGNRIASFTKGLPHNDLGEVDMNAYNAYLQALNSSSGPISKRFRWVARLSCRIRRRPTAIPWKARTRRQWFPRRRRRSRALRQRGKWWRIIGRH